MQKPTYIIAEIGVNHNGSVALAKQMIDVAAESGVDAVKFQTFKAANLVTINAPKAIYQKKMTDEQESQYAMLEKLELTAREYAELAYYCKARKVDFLSTPFDEESLNLLVGNFELPVIKISSGDITNAPFLLKIAQSEKPVILSTGMSSLGDVENALQVLAFGYVNQKDFPCKARFEEAYMSKCGQVALQKNVILLHCTTEYPTPLEEVNLKAMDTLKAAFNLPVGYSDHTEGIAVALAAVARGAVLIEKHFTLDRNLPGPDHQASLEPTQLKQMVSSIREIELVLGDGVKRPSCSELKNRLIARKSLTVMKQIDCGESFSAGNLGVKRPGTGVSPLLYWDFIGRNAERKYEADEQL